ncbi:MAG: DUF2997 domain-containing protein [Candidatus Methanospirareceae archaeon]
MKSVEFLIGEDEKVQVRFRGFKGNKCFLAAKEIYKALKELGVDVNVIKTELTEEYYEKEVARERSVERVRE